MISKLLTTTVVFHFYRFVVKYLNSFFIMKCLTFFFRKCFNIFKTVRFQAWRLINQMLSINCEVLSAFDIDHELRGLVFDISKAFDKVWHAELVYKLRQNGICADLISILNDFLTNRKQRVVLNG